MLGENNEEFTYKNYPGNKPSNTILFEQLTPRVLGMLLALYEHKTFVEAVIWDINPFDQWGVELGKTMANNLAQLLSTNQGIAADEDTSTKFLLEQYRKYNS